MITCTELNAFIISLLGRGSPLLQGTFFSAHCTYLALHLSKMNIGLSFWDKLDTHMLKTVGHKLKSMRK